MNNDLISLIANIALTLSFIIALVFGIAQVKAANRDRQERLTLETIRGFDNHEFAEMLHFINTQKIPKNFEEWKQLPDEKQITYIHFAQRMESLGLLLSEKLINTDLIDKTLGSFVPGAWEKYRPVFMDMREKVPDPYLGEYFQWMSEQIDDRLKNNPRVPVFKTNLSAK